MPEDIAKIFIGNHQIGIIGLNDIVVEIKSLQISDENIVREMLLKKVKLNNYISPARENEYKEALLKYYKKSFGIQIEKDRKQRLFFHILGPGCPACEQMERDVKSILAELNIAADVQHIRDINEIAEYGFVRTPTLVINDKIVLNGRSLPKNQLKKIIKEELDL